MTDDSLLLRCITCFSLNRLPESRLKQRPLCGKCKAVLEVPAGPVAAVPANLDRDIAYWPETLLMTFTSRWCVYCKIYNPVVSSLAEERSGRLKVITVDVDAHPDLAKRHNVTKTPTFVVFKNGTMVVRMDGAPKDKNELITWVENLINYQSY
ncbi:MAG: thioredoxin family protein [Nitrospiraceae bacterium]|nr:thioredoxin family protein [Nitrospiraceae bacterium]